MVVKLSLNVTHVSNFSDPSGQVVVGQVGQTLIVSMWRSEREGVDQTPILYHLGEIPTQAASFRQSVVLTGDWNWTPEENLFVRSGEFQLLAMNDADGYVSSRWKGERAIDYTLLSHGLDGSAVALLPQVFGDHKAFHFKVSAPVSHGDTLVTARTARLHKPVGCSLEDWHAAVTEAWDLSETLGRQPCLRWISRCWCSMARFLCHAWTGTQVSFLQVWSANPARVKAERFSSSGATSRWCPFVWQQLWKFSTKIDTQTAW